MDYKELIASLRHQESSVRDQRLPNIFRDAADAIETLLAERDAAIEDLRGMCCYCAHGRRWEKTPLWSRMTTCEYMQEQGALAIGGGNHKCSRWEWREPIKEAPPFTDYKIVGQEFWDSFFKSNWGRQEGEYEPIGRYILREDDDKYTGMDNSHGCAWVETFDTLEECLLWLSGRKAGGYLDG